MAELTTAVKHGMNITHVLLNNGQLGKISKEQRRRGVGGLADRAPQPGLLRVRPQLRRAGIRVTDAAELDAALAEAVAYDGPAMVEVMADPNLI